MIRTLELDNLGLGESFSILAGPCEGGETIFRLQFLLILLYLPKHMTMSAMAMFTMYILVVVRICLRVRTTSTTNKLPVIPV